MQDREVLSEIERLVEVEQALRDRDPQGGLSPEELDQLRSLETSLDQCWDLLRRRRAKRELGQDPNEAQVRDAETVQRYRQ
jgi:hypothetical protein